MCVCVCARTGVHAPHNTCACLLVLGDAVDCRETQIKRSHRCMKKETGVDSVFDVLPSKCAGQNLKKEAAADIRMHAAVLISAALTHTRPASQSHQGRKEADGKKLITHSYSSSLHSFFCVSVDRNQRGASVRGAAPSLFIPPYSRLLTRCSFMHL